jgi:hypothetical protein
MFMACWGSSPVHRSEHPKTRTLTATKVQPSLRPRPFPRTSSESSQFPWKECSVL